MDRQHQVVLSLGSNQGDRLENIQTCISLIHKTVGTVIRVSKVYETPSWGFESEDFYNCTLLLHTVLPAEKLLTKILEAEKQLGRIRNGQLGYQARIIDIDIITFDDLVIETETLHIPHPQMQNRLFVLLPMQDLNHDWHHPKTNKSIAELITETKDSSDCVAIGDLKAP
ncbi:2-amino-4-hydroxy-6-hydroxymethyldihydropteridine pyrophosphokinase [Flavobacterium enshiense DK69]|uniref:2-amino-4-hydroxy-6- hydroxymethyldihydropteridine diphosphokinase n=1 Tax=Flavobacterium enshiense TaxID=1341165 RepID=UPI0003C61C24|nr:2-amino-4-hydroxy-6-hydroxymethyldihydropteridine diphosphokinase [Flavobacterium enshiense]ESU23238.1 2-amino-4-hydroxy-6-hydroxymethyldihydropteridine pyrophosphokinase [Flavobacterium enshiense DK69]